jgi:hypothetical protein
LSTSGDGSLRGRDLHAAATCHQPGCTLHRHRLQLIVNKTLDDAGNGRAQGEPVSIVVADNCQLPVRARILRCARSPCPPHRATGAAAMQGCAHGHRSCSPATASRCRRDWRCVARRQARHSKQGRGGAEVFAARAGLAHRIHHRLEAPGAHAPARAAPEARRRRE